jgi:hypothetical protein
MPTPPSVPPPSGGLGSNSNYILSSLCNPITGLTITIEITEDIVAQSSSGWWYSGFGFQLNCNSAPDFSNAWQQFIFVLLGTPIGDPQLHGALNDWTVKEDSIIEELDGLATMPNLVLPAGYQLQMQLKNDAKNNIVGIRWIVNDLGFPPAPDTPLTGYWLPVVLPNEPPNLSEHHVNYIGIDGHIHERLHYPTGNWIHNDLTLLSGNGVAPAPGSPLDAYAGPDDGQHINFIGADGHVRELYITPGGQWVNNDLNQLSKGVPPHPDTPLDGYIDGDSGQHVNFIDTDHHVHELYIHPNAQWIDNDLTILSGNGIAPRSNSPLDGYVDGDNGQHVNFIGTDNHVHELYIHPNAQWINNDLTVLSGNDIAPSPDSSLCGYLGPDNGQHINFIGTDNHVHELYIHPNAQWINNDLTDLSGNGTPPAANSPLCGYWGSSNTQHVNFIGSDGHVRELYIHSNAQWINNDLTDLSGNGMVPATNSALHSYAQPNGDQHVNYLGAIDAHLHELYIRPNTQWIDNDLNLLELANVVKNPIDLSSDQFAPINAFQLNLVGPINADSAVLSSGAGNFTYFADTPLTVGNTIPSCTGSNFGTAETANSFYGPLDAGPSNLITQTFTTSTTQPIIHFRGPVPSKGVTLRLKPGEPLKPIQSSKGRGNPSAVGSLTTKKKSVP